MTRLLRFLIVLAALAGAGSHASAQQIEREVLVPLDPARGIDEVDARLRGELGLFSEFQRFEVARLFRGEAGGWVLEIVYVQPDGALARERRTLSDAQLATLRSDIENRLTASGRERVVDRSGRAGLIVGQTLVGLAYHGWVAPVVLDLEDRGAVAAYLLTSGASFVAPYFITRGASVSVAQRDAFFWGATRGILYGLFTGYVAAPNDQLDEFGLEDEKNDRVRFALGSAGSVLGSLLGYHAAGRYDASPGTAALWSAAADFGLGSAFGISYALGLFDEEVVYADCPIGLSCVGTTVHSNRDGYALTVGLGAASLVGAKLWGDAEDYTLGDARALRSFGLLGAQALLPLAEGLFDTSDTGDQAEHAIAASAVAGAWAGLFIGNRVLRRTSLSGGDGALVLAGHVAGGLAALGMTYLFDDSDDIDETVYLSTSAAGSMIGSLLTFRAVRGSQSAQGTGSLTPEPTRGLANAEVTFHPEGAIAGLIARSGSRGLPGRTFGSPLLTVRF